MNTGTGERTDLSILKTYSLSIPMIGTIKSTVINNSNDIV